VILNGKLTPQRFQRVFKKNTLIQIQVRNASTITIARDQGEASAVAQGDGIQLTQNNTSNNSPPFVTWWKGELWYVANVDNSAFSLLIISEEC